MSNANIGAVILAAGLSSRMDGFKPLMHLGGVTLLTRVINIFKSAGCQEIITVIGHRAAEMSKEIEKESVRYVINENFREGMFSSIQRGVAKLSRACDAFFLQPVDIPLVQYGTIAQLAARFTEDKNSSVIYPIYRSRRGHPPLINTVLSDAVLSYAGGGGMRAVLAAFDDAAAHVHVDDPFIHMDVDTREDFKVLLDEYSRNQIRAINGTAKRTAKM